MLPAASLTPLTPDDSALIEAFLALHRNLSSVARHAGRSFHSLLLWIDQPHIQHALDLLNQFQDQDDRAAARAHLRAVADTTTNPTERRRAATSLLASIRRGPARPAAPRGQPPDRPTHSAATIAASPGAQPPPAPIPTPAGSTPNVHTPVSAAPPDPSAPPPTDDTHAAYLAALEALGLEDPDDDAEDRALDEELDRELDDWCDEIAAEFDHLSTEELVKLALQAAQQLKSQASAQHPDPPPLPPQASGP